MLTEIGNFNPVGGTVDIESDTDILIEPKLMLESSFETVLRCMFQLEALFEQDTMFQEDESKI
ncbi:hypothetical protein [Spirosoma endophyticum]|uniref:Uncharacterized protein n=1 Tax=Spirosoma endophyticum TaxID=662367 RepID=A0A1I2GEG1_9BACT|nr:hypothetical protein [Spirosoma endophyticum]SFF15136.1 hypothetical protein SAMN05216167_13128 [Spirosoma endophyticum]